MEITLAFDPTFEKITSTLFLNSEIDNEINRKLYQHETCRRKNLEADSIGSVWLKWRPFDVNKKLTRNYPFGSPCLRFIKKYFPATSILMNMINNIENKSGLQ